MATGRIPHPCTLIALARPTGDIATGQAEGGKNPAASGLGRLDGPKGGKVRADFVRIHTAPRHAPAMAVGVTGRRQEFADMAHVSEAKTPTARSSGWSSDSGPAQHQHLFTDLGACRCCEPLSKQIETTHLISEISGKICQYFSGSNHDLQIGCLVSHDIT